MLLARVACATPPLVGGEGRTGRPTRWLSKLRAGSRLSSLRSPLSKGLTAPGFKRRASKYLQRPRCSAEPTPYRGGQVWDRAEGGQSLWTPVVQAWISFRQERKFRLVRRFINTLIWITAYRMVAAAPIEGYDERVLFGEDKSELLDSVLGPLIPGMPIKRQDANLTMVGFGPIIMASITMQILSLDIVQPLIAPSGPLSNFMYLSDIHQAKKSNETSELKDISNKLVRVFALLQGFLVAYSLRGCLSAELASIGGTFLGIPAWAYQVVPLALGPMMLMWIGDRITNCGIGQGFSLLLCISILGEYTNSFRAIAASYATGMLSAQSIGLVLGTFVFMVIQIPISFFKTRKQKSSYLASMRETGILKEYLPIQTNGSSMMPVIVTLFVLDGVNTLLGLFPGSLSVLKGSALYSVLLFLGCVGVNMISLEDSVSKMGEYTSKIGARIRSVRPGEATTHFLGMARKRATLVGGVMLGAVTVLATCVENYIAAAVGIGLSYTSLLILVGTLLNIGRQVQAWGRMPEMERVLVELVPPQTTIR